MGKQDTIDALSRVLKPEVFVEVGMALRLSERVTPLAIEMFQAGGKFDGAVSWGNSCAAAGFEVMAEFCKQNPMLFRAFIDRKTTNGKA